MKSLHFILIGLVFFLNQSLWSQTNTFSTLPATPEPKAVPVVTAVTNQPLPGITISNSNSEVSSTQTPVGLVAEPVSTEPPIKKRTPAVPLDQKGKIEAIDIEARTFVVAGKTFTLAKRSRVEIDGTIRALEDLKVGDLVAVVYFEKANGLNTPTRIIKGNAYRPQRKSKTE